MPERHHCGQHNLLYDGPECPRCPQPEDYACADRANRMWGSAINGPHVSVIASRLARSEAYRQCAAINREMAGVIGALPGSSIWAALEACAEKMEEIALTTTIGKDRHG